MKNSPVSVVREENQVTITVYAEFSGEHNEQFDNSSDAYEYLARNDLENLFKESCRL